MFARKFPSFGKSLFKPSPRARRAMVLPQAGRRPQLFYALMALGLFLDMAGQAKAQYISLKGLPPEAQRRGDQVTGQNQETDPADQRAQVEAGGASWVCTCCRPA